MEIFPIISATLQNRPKFFTCDYFDISGKSSFSDSKFTRIYYVYAIGCRSKSGDFRDVVKQISETCNVTIKLILSGHNPSYISFYSS